MCGAGTIVQLGPGAARYRLFCWGHPSWNVSGVRPCPIGLPSPPRPEPMTAPRRQQPRTIRDRSGRAIEAEGWMRQAIARAGMVEPALNEGTPAGSI
jgi:hypothetical protein